MTSSADILEPSDTVKTLSENDGKAEKKKKPKPRVGFRTAARLFAVQGLYQMATTDATVTEALETFRNITFEELYPEASLDKFDADLLEGVLRGAVREQRTIDALIADTLADGWKPERIDKVMLGLLRAALYELLYGTDAPAKVVINEYMNIASCFGLVREISMINGILNAVARNHNLIS